MGALERDAQETARTLTSWFAAVRGVEARVSDVQVPSSTGFSNETILFDATWTDGSGERTHELVARIAPTAYQVFLDAGFARQFSVMKALAEQSRVPMARIHWLEEDTRWFASPFWIMERVRGDIPSDTPPYAAQGWLHDAAPEDQARAWWSGIDALVSIHRLDVAKLELPAETFSAVADPLDWHLDHYEQFLTWGEDGEEHELARRVLARLDAERPATPPQGPTLVWGDSRLSNLIYREFEVVAVLDWEMTAIGDPLLDLGWWLFSDDALTKAGGLARLPGFPGRAETAQRWMHATGRSIDALDYYELFAGLRFTVIMLRMGKLLAKMGLVPAEFAYDNPVSAALRDLAERC